MRGMNTRHQEEFIFGEFLYLYLWRVYNNIIYMKIKFTQNLKLVTLGP